MSQEHHVHMRTETTAARFLDWPVLTATSHEDCFFVDGPDHFTVTRKPGIARTSERGKDNRTSTPNYWGPQLVVVCTACAASGVIDPSCSGPGENHSLTLSYLSRDFGIRELWADTADTRKINPRDLPTALVVMQRLRGFSMGPNNIP